MQCIYKSLFAGFFSMIAFSVSAQSYTGFSEVSITLRSDSTTKSVLISNLLADRVGDISPVIGIAAWTENNKKLQCRSLLSFDYGMLPEMIRPEQILEARLILRPVEVLTAESVKGVPSPKFTIRRVTEQWEDSMTSWLTQPLSDANDEVIKSISGKKKYRKVGIDVTGIVQNMFRYGNNGFMIGYADSLGSASFLSQWFASARYEDEKLRPELWIRWSYTVSAAFPYIDVAEMSRMPIVRTPSSYHQQQTDAPTAPVPVPVHDVPPPKGSVKDQ